MVESERVDLDALIFELERGNRRVLQGFFISRDLPVLRGPRMRGVCSTITTSYPLALPATEPTLWQKIKNGDDECPGCVYIIARISP